MIKIAALNATSSDDEGTSLSVHKTATKEAQEAEAFALYNKALGYQRQGEHQRAEDVFHDLLALPFVKEAEPADDNSEAIMQPCLVLKYSICKNLASLYSQRKDYETAMEHYLEAVMVDSSDVSVWCQIGQIALKLVNYPLARHAFEQGLQCSPKHWPCLDKVITILFVLGNYYACLCYIAVALEKDPGYVKGLVFLRQIFTEQPSLKKQTEEIFSKCDPEIYETALEQEEIEEFYGEAVEMRKTRRELLKPTPLPIIPIQIPSKKQFTWLNLGKSLVCTYDHIAKQVPNLSLSCRVDISPYLTETDHEAPEIPEESAEKETEKAADDGAKEEEAVAMETVEADDSKQLDDAVMADEEGTNGLQQFESRSNTPVNPSQNDDTTSSKKSHKRKRSLLEELGGKRRSARVRNIPKSKQEETMNYHEVLLRILPMTLLHVVEGDENDMSQDGAAEEDVANDEPSAELPRRPSEGCFIKATEVEDIIAFAKRLEKNSGIISLLNEFLICVANQATHKWENEMMKVFLDGFSRVRKHIEFPGYLCKDTPDERIKDMAFLCLVQAELYVDKWLMNKPKNSPRKGGTTGRGPAKETMSSFFMEDLSYTEGVSICQSILQPDWMTYCVRVSWLHAQFHMLEGDLDLASGYFDRTNMYLTIGEQETGVPVVVKLPNLKVDSYITKEEVTKQLDSLRRFQSFEDMQRLYEQGSYEEVVTLLLQTFTNKGAKDKLIKMGQQERHTQLLLLQDSLLKMEDFKRGMIWGEVCFDEALQTYLNTTSRAEKEEWSTTMVQLLQGINKCLEEKLSLVRELPSRNVVRLTQNIIKVIDLALDVADNASDLVVPTMLPWMVLYGLVLHEEQRGIEAAEEEDTLPSNLTLLQVAHDYLGGRGLCVCCNGSLLLFIINVLLKALKEDTPDSPHPFKAEIEQHIEQCFYCLFGHPNKRRAKNMQDHTSNQLTLTWERAKLLFHYFKPKSMPEFDSYKINTVSSDLEGLLRRIMGIIPSNHKSVLTVRMDKLTNYMDGFSNDPPTFSPVEDDDIVNELFYLLGDYYFKNKEQGKATKYFQQDLCFNPERFDSWAGVALARASKLEQKLNAYEDIPEDPKSDDEEMHELKWETKTEGATWKQAIAALRCFKRALELDSSNSKLWIEYGSMAYLLHSYASRQLKFQKWYPLGDDNLETAKTNKEEMLKIALNCYTKAGECDGEDNEEQWLSHYMLGKVSEKLKKPPGEYLEHYKLAAHYLHEDKAKYPKKITYVLSPPHLAVESLEVYYRLHVGIVKFTVEHIKEPERVPFELFEKYIEGAAASPFALGCEKRRDTLDQEEPSNASGSATKPKKSDHNYFRRQSSDSGARSDEGSQENLGRREVINQRTHVAVLMSDSAESSSPVQRSLTNSPAHNQGVASIASTASSDATSTSVVASSRVTSASAPNTTTAAVSESTPGETSVAVTLDTTATKVLAMETTSRDAVSSNLSETAIAEASAKTKESGSDTATPAINAKSVDETASEAAPVSASTDMTPLASSVVPTDDKPLSSSSPAETEIEKSVSTSVTDASKEIAPASSSEPASLTVAATSPMSDSAGPVTSAAGSTGSVSGTKGSTSFSMASILGYGDDSSGSASQPAPGLSLVPYSTQSSHESQLSNSVKEVPAINDGKSEKDAIVTCEASKENGEEVKKVTEESDKKVDGKDEPTQEEISNAEAEMPRSETEKKTHPDLNEGENNGEEAFGEDPPERRKSALDDEESKRVIQEAAESLMFLAGSIGAESNPTPFPEYPDAFDDGDGLGKDDEQSSPDLDPPRLEPEPSLLPREQISPESSQDSAEEALERLKSEILFLNESAPQPQPLPELAAWRSEESGRESEDEKKQEQHYDDPPVITKEGKEESAEHKKTESDAAAVLVNDDLEQGRGNEEVKETNVRDASADAEVAKESSQRQEGVVGDGKKDADESGTFALVTEVSKVMADPAAGDSGHEEKMETDADAEKSEKDEVTVNSAGDGPSKSNTVTADVGQKEERMETESSDKTNKNSEGTSEDKAAPDTSSEQKDGDEVAEAKEKGAGSEKSAEADKDKDTEKAKDNDGDKTKDKDVANKTVDDKIEKVLKGCMQAFNLCLSRFPQHYKSYHRLAHVYYYCTPVKNLEYACDLLLGNPAWQTLSHMPGSGLFGERKPTNFFQGLWKIPSEDIDRAGSFASHLTRSLVLLLEVLRDLDDALSLFQIHMQLTRIPDQGKKYLRDNDRSVLASQSYSFCLDALEQKMMPRARSQVKQVRIAYMMECYKIWQYGVKLSHSVDRVNAILVNAFVQCFKEKIQGDLSVMDQAISFCQHQQQLQGISTPTSETSKGFPGAAPIEKGRLSTEKSVKLSDKKGAKILDRSLSRDGDSQGSSQQTSPIKGASKDSSSLKVGSVPGKSQSLQEKLSSIVGRSLSVGPGTSKTSPSKPMKHVSVTQGGGPAKVRKIDSPDRHREAALSLNSTMMAQLGSQLSTHMQQVIPPGGMTPAIATQLSYYYASITGLDPNTVWMSMMMGQYMQEDAIAKAVASAVHSRGVTSPQRGVQGSPGKGSSKSHSQSPKQTSDKALKYVQTAKGLVPQAHSAKPATVTSGMQGVSQSLSTPPPAHSHPKLSTLGVPGTSFISSTPKPAHSHSDPSKPKPGGLAQVRDISQASLKSGVKQKSKKKLGQQHESLLRSIMTSPLYLDLQARAQAKINNMKKSKSSMPKPVSTPKAHTSGSMSSVGSPGDIPTPTATRPQSSSSLNTSSVFQTPPSVPPAMASEAEVIVLSESDSD